MASADCLRPGLADEVRYSILPVLIGDGTPFFKKLDKDVALHLADVTSYRNGMVERRYEVRWGDMLMKKALVSRHVGLHLAHVIHIFSGPDGSVSRPYPHGNCRGWR